MANGTVKWFNATKGFGFIAPESGGKDVFVHVSAVERSGLTGLADDQKVTYDVEAGRDGRSPYFICTGFAPVIWSFLNFAVSTRAFAAVALSRGSAL